MIKTLEKSLWTNQHISIVNKLELKTNVLTNEEIKDLMINGFGQYKKINKTNSKKLHITKQGRYFTKRSLLFEIAITDFLTKNVVIEEDKTLELVESCSEMKIINQLYIRQPSDVEPLSQEIVIEPELTIKKLSKTDQLNILFKKESNYLKSEVELKLKKMILLSDLEDIIIERKKIQIKIDEVSIDYEKEVIDIYKRLVSSVKPLEIEKEEEEKNRIMAMQMIMIRNYGLSEIFFHELKKLNIVKPKSIEIYEEQAKRTSGRSLKPSQVLKQMSADTSNTLKKMLYGKGSISSFEKEKIKYKDEIIRIIDKIISDSSKHSKKNKGSVY
jgi:hypothetical protein